MRTFMMYQGRRKFLKGLVSCGCGFCLPAPMQAQSNRETRRYCFDALSREEPFETRLTSRNLVRLGEYSDPALAAYIEREGELLSQFFGPRTTFYFDASERGAYMDRFSGRYVVLGTDFINNYAKRQYGLLMVSGIIAHEYSHIFQVHSKINSALEDVMGQKVKHVEIHADYLAGAYMAWREKYRAGAPAHLADLFYELGDRKSPEIHHGTSQERFWFYQRGYHDAQSMARNGTLDVWTVAAMGLKHVRQILSG
jgi:hypothetical protein